MATVAVLLFVALAVMPVAADINPWPNFHQTNIPVANPPVRFASTTAGNQYYFVNLTNATGGQNALHITDYTSTPDICQPGFYQNNICFAEIYQDTNSPPTSPNTFYVSDTGGKGGEDDIILLVAVNKTSGDYSDFGITLTARGYNWSPQNNGNLPTWSDFGTKYSLLNTTLNGVTFTNDNFTQYNGADVFQEWKFAPTADYPTFNAQTVGDNSTLFKLIPIDLKVGVVGNKTGYYVNLTDNGMVNVTYSLTGITNGDQVAFNAYAYNNKTITQNPDVLPPGINWLNKVTTGGTSDSSGWVVQPQSP